ncbi:hypothetical protein K4K49_006793 [Colletotrichum sp. SAR 10_70]|nr:hypothetical protein K4K50_003833 [Colletotrichum sp. SAR 10_71]KAI8196372.1 hypothetical protein K4K49_006793 [Colletotrichum sp. SAR 10_70]
MAKSGLSFATPLPQSSRSEVLEWHFPKPYQYTLIGKSRAAWHTSFVIPQLNLLLDAGLVVNDLRPKHIVLTHTHSDHCLLAPAFTKREDPPDIILPTECRKLFDDYVLAKTLLNRGGTYTGADAESLGLKVDGQGIDADGRTEGERAFLGTHNTIPVKPGDTLPLRKVKNMTVSVFKCDHNVPSVGYLFSTTNHKLKPEYTSLPGPEIKKLRQSGVEITAPVTTPVFAFLGDGTATTLAAEPEWLKQEVAVVITECSFLLGLVFRTDSAESVLNHLHRFQSDHFGHQLASDFIMVQTRSTSTSQSEDLSGSIHLESKQEKPKAAEPTLDYLLDVCQPNGAVYQGPEIAFEIPDVEIPDDESQWINLSANSDSGYAEGQEDGQKEHLKRRHFKENGCHRCGLYLESNQALQDHLRSLDICPVKVILPQMGFMTQIQSEEISKKRQVHTIPLLQRWKEIYLILFPDADEDTIPGPYFEATETSNGLSNIFDPQEYECFLKRHLPARILMNLNREFQIISDRAKAKLAEMLQEESLEVLKAYVLQKGGSSSQTLQTDSSGSELLDTGAIDNGLFDNIEALGDEGQDAFDFSFLEAYCQQVDKEGSEQADSGYGPSVL